MCTSSKVRTDASPESVVFSPSLFSNLLGHRTSSDDKVDEDNWKNENSDVRAARHNHTDVVILNVSIRGIVCPVEESKIALLRTVEAVKTTGISKYRTRTERCVSDKTRP